MTAIKRKFSLAKREAFVNKANENKQSLNKALTVPISLESSGPDESGAILRHLLSDAGYISSGVIKITALPDGPAALMVMVESGSNKNYICLAVFEGVTQLNLDETLIKAGDSITLKLLGYKEASGIQVGFMWGGAK